MLNAMAEDLPHVRNHIADALATSTSATTYGPSNIRSRLDVEQQLIDTETSKSGDIAMAATKGTTSQNRSDHAACGNCGNSSHGTKDCFGKGGAMEGKHDEVLARKRAAREARGAATNKDAKGKTTAATGKPGGLRYDTNGRAYLLDSETHQAIYVASAPELAETPAPSTEFAGLASDSITPAFIRELSTVEEDEYTTLIAAIDPLTTSLNWRSHTRPVDFAGITYKAPNQ